MLTRKQHELLLFINRRLAETGISPSFDEMKEALGLRSKSGIHRLIGGLEERGFIKRLAHRARALEVLRLPDNLAPPIANDSEEEQEEGQELPGFLATASAQESVSLPLYGRIAAGTPIEALRDPSNAVDVPANLIGPGRHYALEVDGDSMVEAGILDGDTVLIRQCEAAPNGTIVVALVDEAEVTLKRLRQEEDCIALEPANANFPIRRLPPDRVRIQGKLVALLRQYH